MDSPLFKVLQPGLLTTVQDTGRLKYQCYGFTRAGAMDDFALRVGNRLVGNEETEAGLEITFLGTELLAQRDCIIAVTGANFTPRIDGMEIPMWHAVLIKKNKKISFNLWNNGARAYLCVQGGINVPIVLGSKSTDLKCSFGGHEGRRLKQGDIILGLHGNLHMKYLNQYFPEELVKENYLWDQKPSCIRVTLGPDGNNFTREGYKTFLSSSYAVSKKLDRRGYHMKGPVIEHSAKGPNILTNFTPPGAVQVPGIGTPIILMKDRQTTGGYPKIANAITPDISKLAQKGPGDQIVFVPVAANIAHKLYVAYQNVISATNLKRIC